MDQEDAIDRSAIDRGQPERVVPRTREQVHVLGEQGAGRRDPVRVDEVEDEQEGALHDDPEPCAHAPGIAVGRRGKPQATGHVEDVERRVDEQDPPDADGLPGAGRLIPDAALAAALRTEAGSDADGRIDHAEQQEARPDAAAEGIAGGHEPRPGGHRDKAPGDEAAPDQVGEGIDHGRQ